MTKVISLKRNESFKKAGNRMVIKDLYTAPDRDLRRKMDANEHCLTFVPKWYFCTLLMNAFLSQKTD